MRKKPFIVYVEIYWDATVERVRLDLPALIKRPTQVIYSRETWPGAKCLVYRPSAIYSEDAQANHVIQLQYRSKDHPHLYDSGVSWGTSTITLARALTRATASWKGNPMIEGEDGKAKCKFWVETPSTKKAATVAARKAQQKFKESLLRIDPVCAISGETLRPLLDAAHIQSVEYGGSDEVENGILLRVDLHRLYDAGFFEIKPSGRLAARPGIPAAYAQFLKNRHIKPEVTQRILPNLLKRKL